MSEARCDAKEWVCRLSPPTLVAIAGLCLGGVEAVAKERLEGPVRAEVLRVVDGDTLEVQAEIWLGQSLTVGVRIRGIDAPEMKARCEREKTMAEAATARLAEVTATGTVRLTNIENDKYGGRVLADVLTDDGVALGTVMLKSGLVRAYDGGSRAPWCGVASASE
jgi:endonuclease YncB( thermonuclease family)